jgi:hypothetical protein
LIRHKFGTAENIISDFDFTITKFAYFKVLESDGENESLVYKTIFHKDFFEHLHMKRLVIDDKMVLPINTFERMFRYAKYGYFPCRETKVKMITEIRNIQNFSPELLSLGLYDGVD